MPISKLLILVVYFALFILESSSIHAENFSSKLALDFRTFNFFPETSLGYFAGFNYSDSPNWGIRTGAYFVNRYGENAFLGNLGATYWIFDTWTIDADVEIATHSAILPYYTLGFGTGLTISKVAVPSVSFQFAHFSDADTFTITPTFRWQIVDQVEIEGSINGVLSSFATGRSTGTVSGSASASFAPFDYFSLSAGLSLGEEPFDPGDPHLPLASYFSQKVSGGINFTLEGHLGGKINLAQEWRSDDKTVFSGSFTAYYAW